MLRSYLFWLKIKNELNTMKHGMKLKKLLLKQSIATDFCRKMFAEQNKILQKHNYHKFHW